MHTLRPLTQRVQRALRNRGYNLHRMTERERERWAEREEQFATRSLGTVFGADLERLTDLRQRYATVSLPVAVHSIWKPGSHSDDHTDVGAGGVDLRHFRAHSSYVWNYGADALEATELRFYIFACYVQAHDPLGLLKALAEDGAFGCSTFEHPGIGLVSRDLLDSVLEINFLDRHLGVTGQSDLRVLDIGAGYGRMAHRFLTACPQITTYTCVDAIAESTFLCEHYLSKRGLADRSEVIPLDELDATLQAPREYDLALNIHSFSECAYAAVAWWLRRLADLGVKRLMIVPNEATEFLATETDGSRRDYAPLLAELGYEVKAQEPVFDDPQVRMLMNVHDNMFLFESR